MQEQIKFKKEVRAGGQWHTLKKYDGTPITVITYPEYAEQINGNSKQTGFRLTEIKEEKIAPEQIKSKDAEVKPAKSLQSHKVSELQDIANKMGIELSGGETKTAIISLIKDKKLEEKNK